MGLTVVATCSSPNDASTAFDAHEDVQTVNEALSLRAPSVQAPVGLSLWWQDGKVRLFSGQEKVVDLYEDFSRYIQELDITAEAVSPTDEGITPLINSGDMSGLDWRGVEQTDEDRRGARDVPVEFKSRRDWGGEATVRAVTLEVPVGQNIPTAFQPTTGNCNACHNGPAALGKVLHGIDDRRTCFGCHAPLAMEPDNRLDFRVHFIHTRSNRMPVDPYRCETCHLTAPTGPARGFPGIDALP